MIKKNIKIGFVLEGKTFNFVESIIELLAKNFTVIIGYIGKVYLKKSIPGIRIMELVKPKNLNKNLIYRLLEPFTKQIDTMLIKLYIERDLGLLSKEKRCLKKIKYFLQKFLPKFFNLQSIFKMISKNSNFYDNFLKNIDVIIFIPTSLSDYRIIYEAKRQKKKIISWIYSWDTVFKDRYFVDFADLYLVWNKEIKQDLEKLHNLDCDRIKFSGPVQFDYLKKYGNNENINFGISDKYILYLCSRGDPYYALQEVELICKIAEIIKKIDKEIKFIVRIYPNIKVPSVYDKLKNYENVIIQDNFGLPDNRLYMSEDDLKFKAQLMKNAMLVINFCTTMALEASYFDVPISQINFALDIPGIPTGWELGKLLKGDHLQKYLLRYNLSNIVNSLEELEYVIRDSLKNPQNYLTYTRILRKFADPNSKIFYQDEFIRQVMEFVRE